MSAPREVWVLVDEQGAAFVLDDGHDAVKAALKFPMDRRPTVHRYTLATPPAVSEPFEKIEELPDVLPAQDSAAQTEQDTEATVWVDGAQMRGLEAGAHELEHGAMRGDLAARQRLTELRALLTRCRVAPEVDRG